MGQEPPKANPSPAKEIQSGAEEIPDGAVSFQTVVTVLQAYSVSFKLVENEDGRAIVLYSKDGIPEGIQLPPVIRRKMLHRIAHKYGLKIEWFYHPEMVCNGPKTPQ